MRAAGLMEFLDYLNLLLVRPESKSWVKPAWLLGFPCVLICGMDLLMDTQPFRVQVRIPLASGLVAMFDPQ